MTKIVSYVSDSGRRSWLKRQEIVIEVALSHKKGTTLSSCFVKGVFTFLEMLVYSVPVRLEAPRQSMAYLCICLHIRGIVLVHSAT